jgi:hypothetical protein
MPSTAVFRIPTPIVDVFLTNTGPPRPTPSRCSPTGCSPSPTRRWRRPERHRHHVIHRSATGSAEDRLFNATVTSETNPTVAAYCSAASPSFPTSTAATSKARSQAVAPPPRRANDTIQGDDLVDVVDAQGVGTIRAAPTPTSWAARATLSCRRGRLAGDDCRRRLTSTPSDKLSGPLTVDFTAATSITGIEGSRSEAPSSSGRI